MKKNELYKMDETIIRILKVTDDRVLIIDCLKMSMPVWMNKEDIQDLERIEESDLYSLVRFVEIPKEEIDVNRRKMMYQRREAFQLYAVRDYLKDHETITKMELMRILNENAPKDERNRFQQLTITKKKLQEYFPPFYTKSQMEKILFKLLEDWKKENEKENT